MVYSGAETCDIGRETYTPVTSDYGMRDNEFAGKVRWVQIDLGRRSRPSHLSG